MSIRTGARELTRRISVLLAGLIALAAIAAIPCSAQEASRVTLRINPTSPIVPSERTDTLVVVVVATADPNGLPALTLRARPPLTKEGNFAAIRFPENGNQ